MVKNESTVYAVELGLSECLTDGRVIDIYIPVPVHFDSYQEADYSQSNFEAIMRQNPDGTVVIHIVDTDSILIDVIQWSEWWKYRCTISKADIDFTRVIDPNIDFEPCQLSFEEIFSLLCDEVLLWEYPLSHISTYILCKTSIDSRVFHGKNNFLFSSTEESELHEHITFVDEEAVSCVAHKYRFRKKGERFLSKDVAIEGTSTVVLFDRKELVGLLNNGLVTVELSLEGEDGIAVLCCHSTELC